MVALAGVTVHVGRSLMNSLTILKAFGISKAKKTQFPLRPWGEGSEELKRVRERQQSGRVQEDPDFKDTRSSGQDKVIKSLLKDVGYDPDDQSRYDPATGQYVDQLHYQTSGGMIGETIRSHIDNNPNQFPTDNHKLSFAQGIIDHITNNVDQFRHLPGLEDTWDINTAAMVFPDQYAMSDFDIDTDIIDPQERSYLTRQGMRDWEYDQSPENLGKRPDIQNLVKESQSGGHYGGSDLSVDQSTHPKELKKKKYIEMIKQAFGVATHRGAAQSQKIGNKAQQRYQQRFPGMSGGKSQAARRAQNKSMRDMKRSPNTMTRQGIQNRKMNRMGTNIHGGNITQ